MENTEYAGIDYGLGTSNIDKDTGIRYGVISQNDVLEAWADSSEPDYGDPTCPRCGNAVVEFSDESVPNLKLPENQDWDWQDSDYACLECKYAFGSDEAFPDEVDSYTLNDGEYTACSDSYGDIFITKSPYYTRAQFCSPCAPGAGYLMNPCESGPKTYCFGHDWFEDGKAPYPVFRVSDDSEVLPE